ncbi:MAG: transketolase [Bacilli bacterium]
MFQILNKVDSNNDKKAVDQIRSLGIDMIQNAGSGHPGIVLGAAPIIYTLYAKHIRINPNDPNWINRDRFVMSAGHGSALLYATLFLAGYDLTLDDLKLFRKLDSKTPGHPEYGVTPGVDMSTGPLGQGLASAVGMAMAEVYLKNTLPAELINHYTYVLCGDGDLMEGISYEAASIAGNLQLNKLIVLYDSNHTSLDGKTSKTFTDNIPDRFEALGWNVINVTDGEDINAIDKALVKAKSETTKPTIIEINTVIGKYSKYQGTSTIHGKILDADDLKEVKEKLEVRDIAFSVSNEVITEFQAAINDRNQNDYDNFSKAVAAQPDSIKETINKLEHNDLVVSIKDLTYDFEKTKLESTRVTSGKILNSVAATNTFFLGGSADLSSSNKTYLDNLGDFSSSDKTGKNIWYGVREHAMGAITNGLSLSGIRAFAATFLVFSDYLKPAIRMSALMNLPVIYIFTHDSITVGADGPTHQPIEQLISLRSIPNLEVFRPADANEVLGTYKTVLAKKTGPSAIILGRNEVPIHDTTSINDVASGAYIVKEANNNLQAIIIATGEELTLALKVATSLTEQGYNIRVVSMPSISRFTSTDKTYQEQILPKGIKTFVIEAASSYSWYQFVSSKEYLFCIDTFGSSAPSTDLMEKYNFTENTIIEQIKKLLD